MEGAWSLSSGFFLASSAALAALSSSSSFSFVALAAATMRAAKPDNSLNSVINYEIRIN